MRFICNNINCDTKHFKAKPTIDERTQCPKCRKWCFKSAHSFKDIYIREIDIMVNKINKRPLTEKQYQELERKKIIDLKDIVKALKIEMEGLHEG